MCKTVGFFYFCLGLSVNYKQLNINEFAFQG